MSLFVEKYLQSLTASSLQYDALHGQTGALAAAALGDRNGGSSDVFGSLLARAKYADGMPRKTFESGNANLAVLLRAWIKVVMQKGKDGTWIKIKHEWDIAAAHGIYKKIALVSLAHWLGGECTVCKGIRITAGRACAHCAATPGREPIQGGHLERERIADMVCELEGLHQSHCARVSAKIRKLA